MEQLGVERLDIDPHIEDKLWEKHALEFAHVEQVLMNEDLVVLRDGPAIVEVFGETFGGVPVLVVLARKGEGVFKIVSAFPMSPKQVQWYITERGE